jgi:hypothetical protein
MAYRSHWDLKLTVIGEMKGGGGGHTEAAEILIPELVCISLNLVLCYLMLRDDKYSASLNKLYIHLFLCNLCNCTHDIHIVM